MNGITEPSSSKTHSQTMNVHQLRFFKEHTLDETKLLIFKILKELPSDVQYPILSVIDQYEEWLIIETLAAESTYDSSELSDPEEEYDRRLLKKFKYLWNNDSSENETD